MGQTIFNEIILLLVASVVVVTLFNRFKLPAVLAYLSVGVVIGPYGLGWIPDNEDTRLLAEFGVVFLLFTVGLEFSPKQLTAMRREVLGVGGAQVVLTTVLVMLLGWALGLSLAGAVVVGGVVALSSTAIVITLLKERAELSSRHGRLALGILVFQDLAVIPFLIIISALAGQGQEEFLIKLVLTLLKGGLVVAAILAIGHWLLRPIFHEIAKSRSSELFTLTVLLSALAAAWVTHFFGLSLALGAFLAGMMLAETEFRHQVESDIRPFRDVLLGLFFITVGMLLDVVHLPDILHWVLVFVVAMIVIKVVLIMLISRLMGIPNGVAMRTGIVLAQGGEFGFALLTLALTDRLIDPGAAQIILAGVLVSMLLTPALILYNGSIATRLFSRSYGHDREQRVSELESIAQPMSDHTIICGYGRVGQNIAHFLDLEGFTYIALDLDPLRVRVAREAGEQVNYGDAVHRRILEAAGITRARVLVISFEDTFATLKVLDQVRKLRTDIPVLVRTADDANLDLLLQAGATEVIPETLEASLMMSSHVLMLLGVSFRKVLHLVEDVRNHRYQILRGFFHGRDAEIRDNPDAYAERLQTYIISENSHAVGRTLRDYHLEELGVRVNAVRRHGVRGEAPDPDMQLKTGDTLILYGRSESLVQAERMLASGGKGVT